MKESNTENRRVKPAAREGVEYIPSAAPQANPKRTSPKKTKKSNFAALFAITIMIGVITTIVAAAIAFNAFFERSETPSRPRLEADATHSLPIPDPIIQEIVSNGIAVIRKIDSTQRKVELYNIHDSKTYTFAIENTTTLKNRFGETLVFAELKEGDMVDISFDEGSAVLTSLIMSTHAFQLENISKVKVDPSENLITIGNDHYYYSDKTTVRYEGHPYPIENIDPVDIVTVKGYQNHVYHLEVNKSHGVLSVTNKDLILNGTLEINTNIYVTLDESDEYKLLEGRHKIVIKGSNIEPFTKDVEILSGMHVEIDMSEAKLKAGTITVTSNISDAILTINSARRPLGEALILNHGEYNIVVQKEGYVPFEETVDFTEASLLIEVELEEKEEEIIIETRSFDLITDPAGASVLIDGSFVGVTPLTIELAYGSHLVVFRKEGYLETTYPLLLDRTTISPIFVLQSTDLFMP